jgi:hypothetical protein
MKGSTRASRVVFGAPAKDMRRTPFNVVCGQDAENHPRPNHPLVKVAITLAILGVCYLSYIAFKGLIGQLDEATKMFNEMQI